jgi:hypothetical protein
LSPREKPRRTAPSAGHDHASALGAAMSDEALTITAAIRVLVVCLENMQATLACAQDVVKRDYREAS